MSLRPVAARWFEVLAPRNECARVTGTLARTGAVQVEVRADRAGDAFRLDSVAAGLQSYRDLASRYARYWSRGQIRHSTVMAGARETLDRALGVIEHWRGQADPMIDALQAAEEERGRLRVWEEVLACGAGRAVDFGALGRAGPALAVAVAALPADAVWEAPPSVLSLLLPLADEQCLLALGPAALEQELRQRVHALKGRVLERPAWMTGSTREAAAAVAQRMLRLDLEVNRLYAELDALHEDCGLPEALGDLICLEWFSAHVGSLPASRNLAWVTGWTDDPDGTRLAAALDREGVRGLLAFPDPPAGVEPPDLLQNPAWVRPFEVFVRALGMPGTREVDPSPILAFVAPLLFGYMFGDVGQGLVLAGAGWLLRERLALAPLLLWGGLSATLFGLLFGSVFSREDLIQPLGFSPLHEPLTALALPLGFAVVLLTGGQVLNGLAAHWRGEASHWWATEAGLLVLYLGLVAGVFWPEVLPLAALGAAWFVLGSTLHAGRVSALVVALATLLEDGVRLLVNTVSFARVGAFALAHAGLSAAIVTLAGLTGSELGALLVMLVGNVLVIALEGLVVSIQTTRLILFEFFVRFLRAEGRAFRPLPAPPSVLQGGSS
jgi:V/A-type H+-transporting ATPase subunit I